MVSPVVALGSARSRNPRSSASASGSGSNDRVSVYQASAGLEYEAGATHTGNDPLYYVHVAAGEPHRAELGGEVRVPLHRELGHGVAFTTRAVADDHAREPDARVFGAPRLD